MGEPDKYVLPVAEDLRQFLSFLLFCRDSNPIAQLWWMEEEQFRSLLEEDAAAHREGCKPFLARRNKALEVIARAFSLAPADPYAPVQAMQAAFDPGILCFSDEYYDVLGIERAERS